MATVNREYKDRLFSFIYGSAENKEWTLDLYNAVNGTDYTDPSEINITTIREVLYLGMRNDVSFIITDEMSLYEQQSTYCPNMPLRLLQYSGNLYEKYITERKLNKFGSTLLQLPAPRLVVFYNGPQELEDEVVLRLSDSFPEGAKSDIEVSVRMININRGRSLRLMSECRTLKEYSWLIAEIRDNLKAMEIDNAVDKAIMEMPDDYTLKPFLKAHQQEVKDMLMTEYNEAEAMELFKEDGRKEGREDERFINIKSLIETLNLTPDQAMDALKVPSESRYKYIIRLGK